MSTPALGGLPAADLRQLPPLAPLPSAAQQAGAALAGQKTTETSKAEQTKDVAESAAKTPATVSDIQKALDEVRETIQPVARNLLFSLDEDTGKTVVKVIDTSTDEVIRQIPSEEIISIAKALDKLQGLLLRQEA
ncbi:flagellar protein FlaG [Pseudothauera nasutitermitis]|uniref:Flagellar protein FlaG n=1 Tax=Pseudothauera nasutitermitis TaxID=2565930 RepID=A0A4S4AZV3_9RHOO|nr:flagellar protein FlaG [Pseudothauera nasutitermitis]THF65701.1 flagellar protein FlaG [Pseudothauera nasutitermitis]